MVSTLPQRLSVPDCPVGETQFNISLSRMIPASSIILCRNGPSLHFSLVPSLSHLLRKRGLKSLPHPRRTRGNRWMQATPHFWARLCEPRAVSVGNVPSTANVTLIHGNWTDVMSWHRARRRRRRVSQDMTGFCFATATFPAQPSTHQRPWPIICKLSSTLVPPSRLHE